MAERTGISLRTYQRLESGRVENPPLRYLTNCALVLDVDLLAILEPTWLEWLPLSVDAPAPPKRRRKARASTERPATDPLWQKATSGFLSAERHLRDREPAKALRYIAAAQRHFRRDAGRYAAVLAALEEALAAIRDGDGATRGADIVRDVARTSKYKPR